jgi:hypothetical protein
LNTTKTLMLMALYCALSGTALAQRSEPPAAAPPPSAAPAGTDTSAASPAKATAQSEAGEPRARVSDPAPGSPAPSAPPPAGPAPSATQVPPGAPPGRAPPPGRAAAPKIDRLELGTATVTGDREQPKVMYIVPWKRSDIGDLAGKPMNSLVDEILAPVDRDVFRREVVYYHAVQTEASQNGAPPKPAQQGEK